MVNYNMGLIKKNTTLVEKPMVGLPKHRILRLKLLRDSRLHKLPVKMDINNNTSVEWNYLIRKAKLLPKIYLHSLLFFMALRGSSLL